MDLSAEVLKAIQEGNASLEAFKNLTVERINYLEAASAKAHRPHLASSIKEDFSSDATEHKSAFRKYITKGEQNGLLDMQNKAMSTSSGADGGFAVPKVIDGMIESTIVNISPIRSIAQVVQISTPDYHKLVNIHNSSISAWVGEKAARTSTNTPQLEDINPPMGEVYCNLNATQTMLDDVLFNAEQWLAEEASIEFARAEGAAFISGTGVNQPLGFLSGAAPVATADATRAFGTLEYVGTGASGAFKTLTSTVNPADDFYTLVSKLKAGYRKDACFVMNKATLFAIMGFKNYQGFYVYNPATAPGMQDTLLGYPIIECEDMPTYSTASAYAIAFGNFKRGYLITDRIGTRVLRDPFSNKPYVAFYITKRVGGSLLNSEAIKLLKFA